MLLEQSTVIAYSPLKLVLETNNDTTPHDQKEPNQPNKKKKKTQNKDILSSYW